MARGLLRFFFIPSLLLLLGCNGIPKRLSTQKIVLKTAQGEIRLTVEVANSKREREKGLMNREKLDPDYGMWFIFEDEAPRTFWMKNTKISLDIIFFDHDKKVVNFVENMEPCLIPQCPLHSSKVPARYALEVQAGFIKTNKVDVGDMVL